MFEIIKTILTNVLTALYQPFGFAVIVSVLIMFLYLYAKESGLKEVCRKWWNSFKGESSFRRLLFLIFYTAMILFRTLLNRNLWANPLSNIMGGWTLHNSKGELSTEPIENLILFIPFTMLLFWALKDKILKEKFTFLNILWQSVKIVFLISLIIEFSQLFFRLGTFQFSDLAYNTLGGLVGGFFYWIGCKIERKI